MMPEHRERYLPFADIFRGAKVPQFVRADALLEFDELVRSLRGDADELLRAAGLDPRATRISGRYLPHKGFTEVLELAAQELEVPDFGMRLGHRQTIHILGPLAVALENAETIAEMLLLAERYIHLHDQTAHFSHRTLRRASQYLWSIGLRVRGARSVAQNLELALVIARGIMTRLTEGVWQPLEIWLAHEPISDPRRYRRFFPCEVRFGQSVSGIVMSPSVAQTPIKGRDAARAEMARAYLQGQFGTGTLSLARKVEALIRPLLGVDRCSHDYVAGLLAVHPRTLHRHLREEGTSFEEIKDAQRRSWAVELFGQGLPAGHISGLLGYEHQSAFSRSCLRWFGASPRRALRDQVR
jgi:AraC-like DNA-binding protein